MIDEEGPDYIRMYSTRAPTLRVLEEKKQKTEVENRTQETPILQEFCKVRDILSRSMIDNRGC